MSGRPINRPHHGPQTVQSLQKIDWDFPGYVPHASDLGIHGLHWYPAPFPPALIATLLEILGEPGATFLDPYAGSGVAVVEAWRSGMLATGVDVNHFAIEIARAKCWILAHAHSIDLEKVLAEARDYVHGELPKWLALTPTRIVLDAGFHPDAVNWFLPQVLAGIATLLQWLECSSLELQARSTLRVLLSSVLHKRISVARRHHYTYIVDRSRMKEPAIEPVDVHSIFEQKICEAFACQDAGALSESNLETPTFIQGTSQEAVRHHSADLDLVITSPPYFGMNDYVRSQYLSWLIFQWPGYEMDIANETGTRRCRRSAVALQVYLTSLADTFDNLRSRMRRGGWLAVVLGKSETKLVRNRDLLEEIRTSILRTGFRQVWTGSRRVRFRKINNTPYRRELIWLMQAP